MQYTCTLPTYTLKIYFNIILLPAATSSKRSTSFRYCNQSLICISLNSHVPYMSAHYISLSFHNPYNAMSCITVLTLYLSSKETLLYCQQPPAESDNNKLMKLFKLSTMFSVADCCQQKCT
jgi:hypothetical protein